ncbi:hypothetical protein FNV43_RR22571 [Rhamnella rubrinervis]|uniref:Transposase (putative) gypsy type domain-containing protein n=1 Tax=Rhamnella rubrinervis TaxID=2594499 RepID=A0A8K0DQG2_9ROSA|nr:hypothetical protein FNV43_RR22571 [Rhamnella rubrinervis]
MTSTRFASKLGTKIPSSSFWFWPSSSFPVIFLLRFGLKSDSNPLVFKSFANSYFAPTMESLGSDLVVEEQLVRKNSNRRANSSTGTPRPRQTDEPDVETPIRTPSVKERFDMPSQVKLSAPRPLERADSPHAEWICLYEIAFKIGLRLPFHRIINMVLNFYSIAPGQLIPNSWRYLLGLIVQSEKCGLQINMATFLYFFYIKPSEEGRYTLYARRRIRLFEDAPTSDKGWKDPLEEATSEQQAKQNFEEEGLSTQQTKEILEGIPLLILKSIWVNLKMKISKAEQEATKKKKKDKQTAAKGKASSQTDKGEERLFSMVVGEPSSLPIAIPSGDSPHSKRQRRSSPQPQLKIRAKKRKLHRCWGWRIALPSVRTHRWSARSWILS